MIYVKRSPHWERFVHDGGRWPEICWQPEPFSDYGFVICRGCSHFLGLSRCGRILPDQSINSTVAVTYMLELAQDFLSVSSASSCRCGGMSLLISLSLYSFTEKNE